MKNLQIRLSDEVERIGIVPVDGETQKKIDGVLSTWQKVKV
jgi:hypothetical protein